MKRHLMRIGGQLRQSSSIDTIKNPYNGEAVGEVCIARDHDMDEAITCAEKAFLQTRKMPTHQKVSILENISKQIETRAEELATLITRESGKPIRFSRGEVTRAILTFTLGASECRSFHGETMPIDLQQRSEGRLCLYTRVPRGPVAAISPFNFPLNLIAHKLSPAFAIGSSVVLKPPPQCPITAHILGDICVEAGLPEEALSVLHCAPDVAQRMVETPKLNILSFTGSDLVGWKLKSLAGKKQVLLELGGNAPCVIDEGVNIEKIIDSVLTGAWAHAGQVCIKIQRIYVHRSLFDNFLQTFVEKSQKIPAGDPFDEQTIIGPLIEKQHVERVLSWIQEAKDGGATLHCGGKAKGQVVLPTVLTDVKPSFRVCKDEVFGPVTIVEKFDDFTEVLASCNRSRYGLQAGIFTPRIDHALQAFETLEYGGVLINEIPTFRVDNFPYGGTKDSGFGREGVRFAMEEMTEPKVLIMKGLS